MKMTIKEAALEAGQGGFIRRDEWPEGEAMRIYKTTSDVFDYEGVSYDDPTLGFEDLTSDRWTVAPIPEWFDEQKESDEQDGQRLNDEIANAVNAENTYV